MSKTCLWRGLYHSYLHLFQTEWGVYYMLLFFSENTLRQVETRCLPIGFRVMEISSKSESLTHLSDSKGHNCLRCVHFATRLTSSSSRISCPVFFCQPQIGNIFQQMNIIKSKCLLSSVNKGLPSWLGL